MPEQKQVQEIKLLISEEVIVNRREAEMLLLVKVNQPVSYSRINTAKEGNGDVVRELFRVGLITTTHYVTGSSALDIYKLTSLGEKCVQALKQHHNLDLAQPLKFPK